MMNLLPLDNFCPVILVPTRPERKRKRIIVYGSVTRYGPRNQLPAQEVKRRKVVCMVWWIDDVQYGI